MIKCFKYRIYPAEEQKQFFEKHFGCVRFIYNWGLNRKIEYYKDHKEDKKKQLSLYDLQKELTVLKRKPDTIWLSEVNSQSLTQSLRHLDLAYKHFFRKKLGFPKFKAKRHYGAFYSHQGNSVDFNAGTLAIMKTKDIPANYHRKFDGLVKGVTISKTSSGKYYAAITVHTGDSPAPLKKRGKRIAINFNTHNPFVTVSAKNLPYNFIGAKLKRIRIVSKKLSRQQIGSKRYEKTRIKLAKLHEFIANKRANFLHNTSKKLIEKSKLITIQDIAVQQVLQPQQRKKTRDFNRNLIDKGLFEFKRQLFYKGLWYGTKIKLVESKS